jgi:hypothetical protein
MVQKTASVKPVVAIFFLVLIVSSTCYRIDWDSCVVWSFYGRAIMPDVPFRTIFIEK